MKKVAIITLIAFAALVSFGQAARAEYIGSFDATISVNKDNSIDVLEEIVYDAESVPRHGIYRDIVPTSSGGKHMNIDNITVFDGDGQRYPFEVLNFEGNVRIKIGDANRTFTGAKKYMIRYRATRAVAQFDGFDEIYWNVTGNEWKMPIRSASARVILPAGAEVLQSSCYFGQSGSKNTCSVAGERAAFFQISNPLDRYEGMTIAVGFPKGVVVPYTAADSASSFFDKYWPWFVAMLLPIITLIFSLRHWNIHGRDPKGRDIIVPQYDVPEGLTPMEAVGIVKERVEGAHISAEIIYLATIGYIKIEQKEEKVLGFINTTDYRLLRLKDAAGLPNEFDRKIMNSLFSGEGDSVHMSTLKNKFYKFIPTIRKSVLDVLLTKEYYKNLGLMKNGLGFLGIFAFVIFWASGFFGGMVSAFISIGNPVPYIVAIIASFIIYAVISRFFPAKTEKGVALKEHLLGLKEYLQIAEKDRLKFHNAPEKKPEVFEKLLPFALILGVEESWAKEFQDIYTTPPSWYAGPAGSHFNALMLTHSLSSFSSAAASSISSSPRGSGSGGGGMSGGGGGGGGGGSW